MSIFRFTKKGADPLSGQIDSIDQTYTAVEEFFDEAIKGHEANLDFVEYRLFLLAFALSIHTWSQGKIEIRARNTFVNNRIQATIDYVRLELPYDDRPRFFRGSIVHIPDMKNWLGSLVVKKMQRYLGSFSRDGFTASLVPIIKQAAEDIFGREFNAVSDERYEILKSCIETIAHDPVDRI